MKKFLFLLLCLVLLAIGFTFGYLRAVKQVVIDNQKARVILSARVYSAIKDDDLNGAKAALEAQIAGLARSLRSLDERSLNIVQMKPRTHGTVEEVLDHVSVMLGENAALVERSENQGAEAGGRGQPKSAD